MPGQSDRRAVTADGLLRWRDLEELRRVPQRYARAIDARDIDAVAALFHPDGVVEGARGTASVAAYLENLRSAPGVFAASMHLLGDPLIELDSSGDTAQMDTYALVHQLRPTGSTEGDLVLGVRYLDELVRHAGGWVIRHRRALTLWSRTPPAT